MVTARSKLAQNFALVDALQSNVVSDAGGPGPIIKRAEQFSARHMGPSIWNGRKTCRNWNERGLIVAADFEVSSYFKGVQRASVMVMMLNQSSM